jgi:hypothetical protein
MEVFGLELETVALLCTSEYTYSKVHSFQGWEGWDNFQQFSESSVILPGISKLECGILLACARNKGTDTLWQCRLKNKLDALSNISIVLNS